MSKMINSRASFTGMEGSSKEIMLGRYWACAKLNKSSSLWLFFKLLFVTLYMRLFIFTTTPPPPPTHTHSNCKSVRLWWMAYEILVPQTGFKPMAPAVDTWSLNHWTTGEVPHYDYWSVVSIWRVLREVFWVNGGPRPLRRLIKLRELLLQVETDWCCIAKVGKELVTYTWTSEAQTTWNWTVPSVICREGLTQSLGLMVGFIFPLSGIYWDRSLQIKLYQNCCWVSNEMESIEVSDTESAWQVWHGMSVITQTGTLLFTLCPMAWCGGCRLGARSQCLLGWTTSATFYLSKFLKSCLCSIPLSLKWGNHFHFSWE